MATPMDDETWPSLPYAEWAETCRTLHLWTQIVGKVRLAQTPWLNHSWHAPLYVTPRGLTTGAIAHDRRTIDLEFDFIDQVLRIRTEGPVMTLPLEPMSVAEFYARVMAALAALGASVTIYAAPNELPEALPFPEDRQPRAYDGLAARRFLRVLLQADRVLKRFRTGFLGKASPVHFFWGSFDLAVTRFSGRPAPPHPGGVPHVPQEVIREAYSHEVSSAGFWPGGPAMQEAVFYSYAYPEPPGFRDAAVGPAGARFDAGLGEFLLPYDAVRTARDPDDALLRFLSTTYAAAAEAARWDRAALECPLGEPLRPRPV
ncbi:MAG: Ava [Caulobacteraceae bacterium]|nr:Ava [Caulobacteraceae bacterium]